MADNDSPQGPPSDGEPEETPEQKQERAKKIMEEIEANALPEYDKFPEVQLFEKTREIKQAELESVLKFIVEEKAVEMFPAIKYDKALDYFRGVDFHLIVLGNSNTIMGMLPSFKKDGSLKELKSVDDSIKLGQFMIYVGILNKCRIHPNLIVQPGSHDEKFPKFLSDDVPVFTFDGLYTVIFNKEEDKKT